MKAYYVTLQAPAFVEAENEHEAIQIAIDHLSHILSDAKEHGLINKVEATEANSQILEETRIDPKYVPYSKRVRTPTGKTIGELVGSYIQIDGEWYKKVIK